MHLTFKGGKALGTVSPNIYLIFIISSVVSDSLWPHRLQYARPPCPSPTPRVYSKFISIEWGMPSNHLILCRTLLLPPSIFPSIGVFTNESALRIRWPNIGVSTSASVLPMNIQDWFPLVWTGWISLLSKGLSRVFSNTTVETHQFFSAQLSVSNSHIHTWLLENPQPWLDGPLSAK